MPKLGSAQVPGNLKSNLLCLKNAVLTGCVYPTLRGTEAGSAGVQERQLQEIREHTGVNQEEALNYSCVNKSGCPWEAEAQLYHEFIFRLSTCAQRT